MIVSRKVRGRVKRRGKKYGNKIIDTEWGTFHSEEELKRWQVLMSLEDEQRISNLQRGENMVLIPKFEDMHGKSWSWHYKPDFVYHQNGIVVVEDYKSKHPPAEWRHKELMFRFVHPDLHFFVNERIRGVYEPPGDIKS